MLAFVVLITIAVLFLSMYLSSVYWPEEKNLKKENTPQNNVWEVKYWHKDHPIYKHYMNKFPCKECGEQRTKSLCVNCSNVKIKKEYQELLSDKLNKK